MEPTPAERWGADKPYEQYMGRWSRLAAQAFLNWLPVSRQQCWVDVGCGTGALIEGIIVQWEPRLVIGLDRSEEFLRAARRKVAASCVHFQGGDATLIPLASAACEVAVSGLVLNFVATPTRMVREMARVIKPGGIVAAYVWDYADRMEFLNYFWEAVLLVHPEAARWDTGQRFPLCKPEALHALWHRAGLKAIHVQAIDIPTVFQSFEDYWLPFLSNQGTAPTYLASLDVQSQARIRALLEMRLVPAADGTIPLTARAWAVQGRVAAR